MGRNTRNIQVKASQKRVTFFPMPPSNKVNAGPYTWYVLLRWLPSEERFEGFMLSGIQARAEVRRGEEFQAKRIAGGGRTPQSMLAKRSRRVPSVGVKNGSNGPLSVEP